MTSWFVIYISIIFFPITALDFMLNSSVFYWKCSDAVVRRLCVNPSVLLDLSLTSDDPVNGRLIALPTEEMTTSHQCAVF